MVRISAFFIFVVITSCAAQQKANPQLTIEEGSTRTYNALVKQVEIDMLGAIYIVDKTNRLTRNNILNGSKMEYVDNRLGSIDDVDARNPLNIMVFFQQYGIVKILDNTLSAIRTVSLQSKENLQNVSHVCVTNDNKLWLFDENFQRVYKVDADLNKMAETNRLSDLGLEKVRLLKMRESNNKLVLLIDGVGLLVFDNFGQFLKKIPTKVFSDFSLWEDKIIQYQDGRIHVTDLSNPVLSSYSLSIKTSNTGMEGVRKFKDKWLGIYPDGVEFLKME